MCIYSPGKGQDSGSVCISCALYNSRWGSRKETATFQTNTEYCRSRTRPQNWDNNRRNLNLISQIIGFKTEWTYFTDRWAQKKLSKLFHKHQRHHSAGVLSFAVISLNKRFWRPITVWWMLCNVPLCCDSKLKFVLSDRDLFQMLKRCNMGTWIFLFLSIPFFFGGCGNQQLSL